MNNIDKLFSIGHLALLAVVQAPHKNPSERVSLGWHRFFEGPGASRFNAQERT